MIEADKYILGISGGKDSAALAIYMAQGTLTLILIIFLRIRVRNYLKSMLI